MVRCNMTPEEQEAALALFPAAPSTEELARSRCYFEQFLFYETWGRRNFREYFCPTCGLFEIDRPWTKDAYIDDPFQYHHKDIAQCPICGEQYTLICLGRAGEMKGLASWRKIAFLRSADGVLTVSAGEAVMEYSHEDLFPLPRYFEKARYVAEPGKRQMWKRKNWFEQDWRGRWEPTQSFFEPFPRTHWMGTGCVHGEVGFVGAEHIKETSMRYCQLEEFLDGEFDTSIYDGTGDGPFRGAIRYLGEYSAHPQIEMLVKLGHLDVVRELLEQEGLPREAVNWGAKTPAAFFRMTRPEYKQFLAAGGSWNSLKQWRKAPVPGLSFTEYTLICGAMPGRAAAFFLKCNALDLDYKKTFDWLREQAPCDGERLDVVAQLWLDYLDMAQKLERNLTFRRNVFPEDLQNEHDAAAAQVEYAEQQAEKKKYRTRYRRLRKIYEYTNGQLLVVVPASAKQIIEEGKSLVHCVGGYAERHIAGKTTILFLRWVDEPQKPYVTIEINDAGYGIRQAHGFRNEADGAKRPMERHKEFFDEWLAWLKRGSPRTRKGEPIRLKKLETEVETA